MMAQVLGPLLQVGDLAEPSRSWFWGVAGILKVNQQVEAASVSFLSCESYLTILCLFLGSLSNLGLFKG